MGVVNDLDNPLLTFPHTLGVWRKYRMVETEAEAKRGDPGIALLALPLAPDDGQTTRRLITEERKKA